MLQVFCNKLLDERIKQQKRKVNYHDSLLAPPKAKIILFFMQQ